VPLSGGESPPVVVTSTREYTVRVGFEFGRPSEGYDLLELVELGRIVIVNAPQGDLWARLTGPVVPDREPSINYLPVLHDIGMSVLHRHGLVVIGGGPTSRTHAVSLTDRGEALLREARGEVPDEREEVDDVTTKQMDEVGGRSEDPAALLDKAATLVEFAGVDTGVLPVAAVAAALRDAASRQRDAGSGLGYGSSLTPVALSWLPIARVLITAAENARSSS
jgi:hypothetical protein